MWSGMQRQLFSLQVMSDTLRPHGLQHARLPGPSLSPRVCSNSCPLSWWCHLTILSSVAPFSCLNFSQNQGLFQWVCSLIRWPRYWSFSFRISPSSEYSGLISLMIDWFDLLAVQGALNNLLEHHSLKTSDHRFGNKALRYENLLPGWTQLLTHVPLIPELLLISNCLEYCYVHVYEVFLMLPFTLLLLLQLLSPTNVSPILLLNENGNRSEE